MIEARNLTLGYPGKQVLTGLNLTIPRGKITVIAGPNGCGKSTLLKAICGMLPIQEGELLLDGSSVRSFTPNALARKVACLAQNRRVPDITAERLVLHGRFPYLSYPRRYRESDFQAAHAAMERMGVTDLAHTLLADLSGGQRQKVYIAMALAQDTPWVLLDEPTAYLDVSHQLQMMDHARFLCSQGKSVVMVLHDLPLALKGADHMLLMDQGKLAAAGTGEEVFASGKLEEVFGVRLGRVQTESGWQYFVCGSCNF